VERANDWCCAGVSCAMDYRAGCCYRHRPRRPPLPPASGELGTQATGLCAKRTFCPLFFTPNSGVELRWASQTGKSVFLACDSAAPAGIGRIRNTGHRPVRQADILSAFPCAKQRSGTPLGAQTRRLCSGGRRQALLARNIQAS